MLPNIKLWVQSDCAEKPDVLSINGEKISPSDERWMPNVSFLLNNRNKGLKLKSNDYFSLYMNRDGYTMKGILSQCDVGSRNRVFTSYIQGASLVKSITILESELKLYCLSVSKRCNSEIKGYLFKTKILVICIILVALIMATFLIFKTHV